MADLGCPMHPEAHLIEDHRAGDMVCPECGLVVGDSRVGAPENSLLSGSDLSTTITAGPSGSRGYEDGLNLVNIQRKQVNSSDRQLIQAFGVIREMAERIHLPKSIQDQANKLFKDVLETKALKGKNSESVAAACLYIACRKENVPRTFKEICAISRTNKKEIGKCFRLIIKTLETNLNHITSDQFMSRFCANLDLPPFLQQAATHIAKKAVELNLVSGRSPISIAAASIYMASQASPSHKRSAKEIGEIAGAAEVTIKQTYKLLYPKAVDLFPTEFRFASNIKDLPAN